MPRINAHAVFLHDVLDFVDDGSPSSLDAQNLCCFNDMVGCRLLSDDTLVKVHSQFDEVKERDSSAPSVPITRFKPYPSTSISLSPFSPLRSFTSLTLMMARLMLGTPYTEVLNHESNVQKLNPTLTTTLGRRRFNSLRR